MELLNPGALWLLPLLILLVLAARRRAPPERRYIANPHLWKRSIIAQGASPRRLRKDWHLLLQLVCALSIVLGLARPTLSRGERRAIFVFDASASMGARDGSGTRLDAARARARDVLRELPPATRVRVMTATKQLSDIGEFAANDAAFESALARVTASAGSTDLPDLLAGLRAQRGGDVPVYAFSDRVPEGGSTGGLHWRRVGSAVDNLAITALAARRIPQRPGDGQILAQLRHFGDDVHDTRLTIRINGLVTAERQVQLGPRASETVVLDAALPDGVATAQIDSADGLAVDNQRWTRLLLRQPIATAFRGKIDFFLQKAVSANPLVVVRSDATGADVIVCGECGELPPGRGSVLLLPLSESSRGSPTADPESIVLRTSPHPITDGMDFNRVTALPVGAPATSTPGDTLLSAGQLPALRVREHDGRRVVELRVQLARSALALDPAFPVLVANALDWLVGFGEAASEVVSGDLLRWPPVATNTVTDVIDPNGRSAPFVVNDSGLTVTQTGPPGIYRVRGTQRDRTFVVNPATATESDLSVDTPLSAPATTAEDRFRSTSVRTMTPLFLLVALAALAVEWLWICRRRVA
jgi:Ca-activated chloride channel homolog